MTSRVLHLLLVPLLVGCSERPTLLIELLHPAGLDPAAANGTLKVGVLRAGSGELLDEQQVTTDTLGSRKRLFDGLGLQAGERYRLRLEAQFDAGENVCTGSAGRAVGLSPPFRYDDGLDKVLIYVDCADGSSVTGSPKEKRIYHSATFVSSPAPHGQVLLVAGATPSTDLEHPDTAQLLDSVERYDPATGGFSLLPGKLGRPRMLHRAVAVGDDVIVSGGMDRVTVVSSTQLVALQTVERIRDGRVAALADLKRARGLHGVGLVGGRMVVAAGAGSNLTTFVKEAEVYDPAGASPTAVVPLTWPRISMAAVPLGDGRRMLLSGGLRVAGVDVPDELLCLSGSCPCGTPPCAQLLDGGFGVGKGRWGVTGTLVPCEGQPGEGAVYLVGGNYEDSSSQVEEYFSDIHCLDVANPTRTSRVGALAHPRSGHTTTLVRGPDGRRRLLVAGGSGPNSKGVVTLWGTAELIDVSCSCQPISAQREVALRSQRALHTATLLADGSVLLAGGVFIGDGAERFVPDL